MNYDFLASKADKLKVLDFIFSETDLRIYDCYSVYDQEINEYNSVGEIASKFDLEYGGEYALTFHLWTSRHKGYPIFRRIELDPRRVKGHSFRYSTNGWGLIQLYFGGLKDNTLNKSHIGHFNKKGALTRETANSENGSVNDWDWTEIEITSRKLKYQINNKLSVRKIGSKGVMPGAEELEKMGVKLA